ncbi:BLUF domain-containing protein [Pricia sp.]|uniref:BLUF domain-containing protein n=1 Tax=Pricia sp. TaxID=2268138 RepID=UPI0035931A21
MYQLNYHSVSRPGLGLEDFDQILEEATAENSSRNISGCLVYHNSRFVQILEGRKKDVLKVYRKIKADKRHHSVTLLWESDVESRYFDEWNMAFYRPGDENVKRFVNKLKLLSALSERTSGALLSFWASVGNILRNGATEQLAEV